jgi:hypothetical protein
VKPAENGRKFSKNQALTKILAAFYLARSRPANFSEWFGEIAKNQDAATCSPLPAGGGGFDPFHIL